MDPKTEIPPEEELSLRDIEEIFFLPYDVDVLSPELEDHVCKIRKGLHIWFEAFERWTEDTNDAMIEVTTELAGLSQ